jgi:amino acid transporter
MVTILIMMLLMGFGAAALGKRFRIFTVAIFAVFIVFGVLSGMESPHINANLPTPKLGTWERINIGAFMIWVIVFANVLLHRKNVTDSFKQDRNHRINAKKEIADQVLPVMD